MIGVWSNKGHNSNYFEDICTMVNSSIYLVNDNFLFSKFTKKKSMKCQFGGKSLRL